MEGIRVHFDSVCEGTLMHTDGYGIDHIVNKVVLVHDERYVHNNNGTEYSVLSSTVVYCSFFGIAEPCLETIFN